jgi:hypothetical protein
MKKNVFMSAIGTFVLIGVLLTSCMKEDVNVEKSTVKGTLKTGSDFALPIYMGQNTLIGEALIYIEYESVIVEVILDEGFVPQEAHLYAGENPPPSSAPGQFPYHWNTGDEFPIVFSIDISEWYECQEFDWYFALHLAIGNETAWILPEEGGTYWLNKKGKPTGWGQYFLFTFEECPGEEPS